MDERSQFPVGENLIAHSNPENERGELVIPLPFETEDVLTIAWEKIPDFPTQDDDWLYKWGKHNTGNRKGVHVLGKFFLNGEELERAPVGHEEHTVRYRECRFDAHRNEDWGDNQYFEGEHGFDCTRVFNHVPKAGQFKATTPVEEILSIRFGSKGSYKLCWQSNGGSKWTLKIDTEKYTSDQYGDVLLFVFESFQFDFFEKQCDHYVYYGPKDLWRSFRDELERYN